MVDALFRYLFRPFQRLVRRRLLVLDLVAGEEPADVHDLLFAEMLFHPAVHPFQLFLVVVHAWHDERGDLEVHLVLVQPFQRVQHGLQLRARPVQVGLVREGFEVDVRSVQVWHEFFQRLLVEVPVAYHDGPYAFLLGELGGVEHVLVEHRRFRIGEGEHVASFSLAQPYDLFRGHLAVRHVRLLVFGMAYRRVLAPLAEQVAPFRGDGEHPRPRQEVVERLLLDGVDRHAARLAVRRRVERPVDVLPRPARASSA